MSEVVAVRLIIHGRVQGVGFRAWTQATGLKLGLVGWVRNLTNGSVEALIQGPAAAVEQMIVQCSSGPRFSKVERVERFSAESDEAVEEFVISAANENTEQG